MLLTVQVDILITDLVAQRQKRSMIEAFYSSFTASHDLANLRIRHIFDKLQDEKILSLRRQASDETEKRFLFLGTNEIPFGMVSSGRRDRHIVQRDLLPAASVAMPIGNQIMCDPIQPGRERDAAVCVVVNVIHRPLKNARSEILRIMEVPRSVVHIVEDAVYITSVELTKCITVTLRSADENIFFVEFDFRHV